MVDEQLKKNEAAKPEDADVARLRAAFPDCFAKNGAVDFEKLQAKFDGKVKIENEGYRLDFLGKSYARLLTALETTTVVKPDLEHNQKPENAKSRNVYLTADNLDALKQLVKSYAGEVKMIYIDPPYNTGSDGFVYNDKFNFTERELCDKLGVDEQQAKRILGFTKRNASSHSAWLMFMYPRLMLARELLTKDGVIFISIDDNEQANLKLLCDDVFGEENCMAMLSRRTKSGGGSASDYFAVEHDYVLAYARNAEHVMNLTIPYTEDYLKRYKEEDEKGRYFWDTMERSCTQTKPYHIEAPDGTMLTGNWFRKEDRFLEDKKNGEIRFLKKDDGTWSVQFKQRLATGKKMRSLLFDSIQDDLVKKEFKSYSDDLDALNMSGVFSYPKTVHFLKYLFQLVKDDAIIVDFFSGSGTTGEAAFRLNLERLSEAKKLRFIIVQIDADLNEELKHAQGEAKEVCQNAVRFLADVGRPLTLDQIGIERNIRAAKKIRTENPEKAAALDLGFKHYTLVEPSQETLDKVESFDKAAPLVGDEGMLKEFGLETVLATWMVRDGYGFGAEPEVVTFGGYAAYWHEKHLYFVKDGLNEQGVKDLMDRYETDPKFSPVNVVIFGYGVSMTMRENLKTNLAKLVDSEKDLKVNIEVRY